MCFVIVIFVLVVAAAVVADVVVLVSNLVVMVLSLVLVLVLVRQGQEITAYHPTCLRVRDKTDRILERSIQHARRLRTRSYFVATKICKLRTKCLHGSIPDDCKIRLRSDSVASRMIES